MPGLIRVDSTIGLTLIGEPKVCIEADVDKVPSDDKFSDSGIQINNSNIIESVGKNPFWIRIKIKNANSYTVNGAVRIFGYGDKLSGFIEHQTKQVKIPFSQITEHRENFFPGGKVNFSPGESILYVHFQSASYRRLFGIDVVSASDVKDDKANYYYDGIEILIILTAFFMLLAFQILYVIIQLYYHKRKEYREYLFYLVSLLVYFFIKLDNAYGDYLLSRININFSIVLNDVLLILPFAFYLRFSRYFIGMQERSPKVNRQVKIAEKIIYLCVIPICLLHFSFAGEFAPQILTTVTIFLFLFSVYLIRYFYLKRDRIIRFLLAGSLFAVSGHVLAMGCNFFPDLIYVYHISPIYFTIIGLVFEIFFFNTGLGYKSKYEQEEKIKAQEITIDQMDRNSKMQMRLEGMRDKIASDLHDDVGSTLSSISVYSQLAIKTFDSEPEKAKGILARISDSTQRMMESMGEIVWAIHPKNDVGEGLKSRILQVANERLDLTGINIKFEFDGNIDSAVYNMEARRNIVLIIKEAINNIAKYSEATEVFCSVKINDESLTILISDNGKGFDINTTSKGNGTFTMNSRVKALKGIFKLESEPGVGTSISVFLPLKEIIIVNNNIT